MRKKFVAFDIESASYAPDSHGATHNVGVTCIGVCKVNGNFQGSYVVAPRKLTNYVTGKKYYERTLPGHRIEKFLQEMLGYIESGWQVVGYNSAGFDIRAMSYDGTMYTAKKLALAHTDIAFQMFCQRGFMIGLGKMAKDFGLAKGGLGGLQAIRYWASLDPEKQQEVLQYVEQDAVVTARLYASILDSGGNITWDARRGGKAKHTFITKDNGQRLLNVRECTRLRRPNVDWIKEPWKREKFVGWLGGFR